MKIRRRTSIELSPENEKFWKDLPHGTGYKLVNFLFDEVRALREKEGKDSIRAFLHRVFDRSIRVDLK